MKVFILIVLCAHLSLASHMETNHLRGIHFTSFFPSFNKPLSCHSDLACAIYFGREEYFQRVLSNNSEIVYEKIGGGLPIHYAIECGKDNIVKMIVDNKPDMINVKNDDGKTPLIIAAEYSGTDNLMEYLIDKGADENVMENRDRTALHWCIVHGRDNIAKLLIENHADVNAADAYGQTPLHTLAGKVFSPEREHIAKLLIANGANVNAKTTDGSSPLHVVGFFGSEFAAKILIDNNAIVDARDNKERTPLHYAAIRGNKEVVTLLLEHNADINARDKFNKTPCDSIDEEIYRKTISPILKC